MPAHFGTLEQWKALQSVVDHGGYAQAAKHLHRSQSTVNYAVAKLERQLGIALLEVHGRKARLTDAGKVLLARSRQLLRDAEGIGTLAGSLTQGRESEIRLVVDAAFPTPALMQALKQFEPQSQGTRVQLLEVVLTGAEEALLEGNADLVITGRVPSPYLGRPLVRIEFVVVAHPEHELHTLNRELSMNDLSKQLQVVIRDSGVKQRTDFGWLGAEHRWTVTSMDTAVEALTAGLGFAWLPRHLVQSKIESNELKELPLSAGQSYYAQLYLVFGKPENTGVATKQLANILCRCAAD